MQPRPNFETEADRRNQEVVLYWLRECWNCEGHRERWAFQIDFTLLRDGDAVAWAEIKCRPGMWFGKGDGYRISLTKHIRAWELTMLTGRPCFFIGWFADGTIRYRPFNTPPITDRRIEIFGRKDVAWNEEPCPVFGWDTFKLLVKDLPPPEKPETTA
jgi:hypothetical protein